MRKDLPYYAKAFAKLNVNKHRGRGVAPHTPMFLISVIECKMRLNQVPLSPELISTFLKYWCSLVRTALWKNHHWAFDHGWFGAGDDYRIVIPQGRFMEEPAVESR
jgi:putative restriction endonuclease